MLYLVSLSQFVEITDTAAVQKAACIMYIGVCNVFCTASCTCMYVGVLLLVVVVQQQYLYIGVVLWGCFCESYHASFEKESGYAGKVQCTHSEQAGDCYTSKAINRSTIGRITTLLPRKCGASLHGGVVGTAPRDLTIRQSVKLGGAAAQIEASLEAKTERR